MDTFSNRFEDLFKTSISGKVVPTAMAQCFFHAHRFYDLAMGIKMKIETKPVLNNIEQVFFSKAFKYMISVRKNALKRILQKQTAATTPSQERIFEDFQEKLRNEIEEICMLIVHLIDDFLIPNCGNDIVSTVSYTRIKADYLRYLTYFTTDEKTSATADKALKAYQTAYHKARTNLHPTNDARLGVAVNYAIFCYTVLGDAATACMISQQTIYEYDTHSAVTECTSYLAQKSLQKLRTNMMFLATAAWVQTQDNLA